MKLFKNALGISAAGVLAIAVLGGAVGGTLALRQGDEVTRTVNLDQVAETATPTPSPAATLEVQPSAAPVVIEEPAVATAPKPVTSPAPVMAPVDRAESAAKRAEEAAAKSEKAAERAEEAAEEVAPVAVPAKAAEPAAPAKPEKVAPAEQPVRIHWGFPCGEVGATMTDGDGKALYCDTDKKWERGTAPEGLGDPTMPSPPDQP